MPDWMAIEVDMSWCARPPLYLGLRAEGAFDAWQRPSHLSQLYVVLRLSVITSPFPDTSTVLQSFFFTPVSIQPLLCPVLCGEPSCG